MITPAISQANGLVHQNLFTAFQKLRGGIRGRHSCNVQEIRSANTILRGARKEEHVLRQEVRSGLAAGKLVMSYRP